MKTRTTHTKTRRSVKVLSAAVVLAVAGTLAFIMCNHIGLQETLDFGAGAYFYTDIPNFSTYIDAAQAAFSSSVPDWLIFTLFAAWGFVMYRLWVWLEKKL